MKFKWLEWTQNLQSIAQAGLTYATNPFDIERYQKIRSITSQMLASLAGATPEIIDALFSDEKGYTTPKVDIRGVVFRENTILLVKENLDQGRWSLPGGWVDVNESPSEAVVREIFEESGYRARAIKLLALYDRNKHGHPPILYHTYKLFFLCEIMGGEPTNSIETDGAEFFPVDALPELSLSRIVPSQIHQFVEHQQHPEWPTDFD